MLRNSKNATILSEMLDLEGVGPPFLLIFANFSNVFFYCFLDGLFAGFWQSWASKGGPFWSQFSQILQILHKKSMLELGLKN